jgi:F1F0 ATPase subunit 2
MSALTSHALALFTGALLGAAFFQGLWITLKNLPASRRPALRILISLLMRLALAAGVFVVLARYGEWSHLVVAAIGFAALRLLMVQRMMVRCSNCGHAQ